MLVEFRVYNVSLRTASEERGQSTSECSHTMIDSLTLEAEQSRKCCEQALSSLNESSPGSELRVCENRGDLQPRLLTTSPTTTHRSSPATSYGPRKHEAANTLDRHGRKTLHL